MLDILDKRVARLPDFYPRQDLRNLRLGYAISSPQRFINLTFKLFDALLAVLKFSLCEVCCLANTFIFLAYTVDGNFCFFQKRFQLEFIVLQLADFLVPGYDFLLDPNHVKFVA